MSRRDWSRVGRVLKEKGRTLELSPATLAHVKQTCNDIVQEARISVRNAEERFERSVKQYSNPPSRLFDALMKVYADRGQYRPCLALLSRMKAQGVQPQVYTYSIAIHGCRNFPESAEHLFEDMKRIRVQPNVFTYTALMKALSEDKPSRKDSKFGLLQKFFRIEQLWHEMTVEQSIRPTQHTYSVYLNACARAGRSDKAEAVFQDMISRGERPDEGTVNSLLALRASTGSNFLPLLQTMTSLGHKVDEYTFAALAKACVAARNPTVAEGLFQQLKKPSVRAFGALLRCYTAAGDEVGAERVINRLLGAGLVINGYILATMAKLYMDMGLLDKLKKCFNLAETEIHDREVSMQIGTLLITALVGADRLSEAEDAFEELLQKDLVDVVSFVQMIKVFVKCHRLADAEALFEKACQRSDLGSRESLYNLLITGFLQAGDVERAEKLAESARKVLKTPSFVFYSHLAKVYGAKRDAKLLRELMKEVKDRGIPLGKGFFGTLIQQFGSLEQFEDVELVLKESQLAQMCDERLWRGVVRLYLCSGRILEAQDALKRMRKAGYVLDKHTPVSLDSIWETMSKDTTLH
eukprot:Plantae.Rhodophyta-Purpureofilum_apyrenoidigerum.ctg13686.p1 GENE.Plantae.Rhodophyta-Purpureofilum_apyrenoidigerum.ctg13686~~Plantae.Rhodophyta-Purpureofilum_apyrenoidigerum.ctg13686.p1  ORF type:complete len:581 (-),score=113.11 Plantae.Rhodophyta-Purpureofilum_apyrenoidigerum.ctg13686:198-1940(-)